MLATSLPKKFSFDLIALCASYCDSFKPELDLMPEHQKQYITSLTAPALTSPEAVFISPRDGAIYVLNESHWPAHSSSICVFSSDGVFQRQFAADELKSPRAIAFLSDGFVVVADWSQTDLTVSRIVVLSPQGELQYAFGKRGLEDGDFACPGSVAVYQEEIYVADGGRNNIQVFDAFGGFERSWAQPLYREETYTDYEDIPYTPRSIHISAKGEVFVLYYLQLRMGGCETIIVCFCDLFSASCSCVVCRSLTPLASSCVCLTCCNSTQRASRWTTPDIITSCLTLTGITSR